MVQWKTVHVQYLPTHEQIVDIFTKLLARMKFEYFRERLGLVENASLAEREGVLMIATLCDIIQDTFSSVTELSRPVREPSVGCAHVMGCIVLLWTELSCAPVLGVPM
jgi:hypothetical protein